MKVFSKILQTSLMLAFTLNLGAETGKSTDLPKVTMSNYNAFTGKVIKNKVRMRTTPNLDAPIVKELDKGELLLIVGENDDFFAVQPPTDLKGYIFRTFVLDNKIEGTRVNVRLSPNTDAPVIAQMNNGDPVEGTISTTNNKWLEIVPPTTTHFYIAKEYIEQVGDRNFLSNVAKRKDEVNRLLQSNYAISQQEFLKAYPDIQIDRLVDNYQKIGRDYPDFPEQAARAKELLEELQDNYLHKKIAYLEAKIENDLYASKTKKSTPVQVATVEPMGFPAIVIPSDDPDLRMAAWVPVENGRFEEWNKTHEGSKDDFYESELQNSVVLKGTVTPYSRPVKNKPGDFMLVNKDTHQPMAFIYSTKVRLHDYVGKDVVLHAAPRPNNHFAYPAYFILNIDGNP